MRFARLALPLVTVLVALATAACAPDVLRRPTQLTPVSDQPAAIIEVMDTAIVSLERGFRRRIPRGSTWTLIGRSPEGEVFRPVNQVFTAILDGNRVVGFYLPVERAFAPARGGTDTRLSIRRRER